MIDADFVDSDLSGFLADFNVVRTGPATNRIKIDGGPPGGDGSPDSLETSLDVETIVSNAPGTALSVYEFPSFNNLQYITDAYTQRGLGQHRRRPRTPASADAARPV